MTDKRPFDKEQSTKIPFSELVELIHQKCIGKCVIARGVLPKLVPYVLIVRCFSIRFHDQLFVKKQLFHNKQVKMRKNNTNYLHHAKNYYLCPFIIESITRKTFRIPRLAVTRQKNLEIRNAKH